jgi:imidazolonepropionase-like amidohydrolase
MRHTTLVATLAGAVLAAGAAGAKAVIFQSVRVFDGMSAELSAPTTVVVRDDLIASIGEAAEEPGATMIDGGGRTLMPGLIDAHTHIAMSTISVPELVAADPTYVAVRAGAAASDMLMRGFTSARDVGGPVFGVKQAIDQGHIVGPRIWPSGAMISQTSGHADFRQPAELPWAEGDLHFSERAGFAALADGRDAVLRATREQLMLGASQIKVMAGGGASSPHDPLDSMQYTDDELRAAVEAAADWNTYVAVHAYTPDAITRAIEAGVLCIEHGHLADDAAAKTMADQGVWWSLQPFLDDEDAVPFPEGSSSRAQQLEIVAGTDRAYSLAKKYGVRTAWGTDTLFSARLATRQGAQLAKMVRWYSPAEVLKMATHDNAELLVLSGPRNPYPGKLGVVEPGALADLLLVDGDPIADIDLIADPAKNFLVIMKHGKIYKNALP